MITAKDARIIKPLRHRDGQEYGRAGQDKPRSSQWSLPVRCIRLPVRFRTQTGLPVRGQAQTGPTTVQERQVEEINRQSKMNCQEVVI